MSKPGSLASAANLAIFWSICVVACSHYGLKQLKSSFQSRSTPEKDERKKLIVISGCDRGIGRLLAEKLQQSTEYIALALTLTKEAAQELKDLQIYSFQCNVTSEKDVKAMKAYVETIVEKEKAVLYTIVNNAGIADPGDFAWFPDINIHKRVMDVNYFGQLRVTQALLPIMLRTTPLVGGRILNMSSVCGTSASPANSAYNASKFAVEAWSDSLRLELKPFNISVVKVRPGQFSTEIQKDWTDNLVKNFAGAPNQIRELYGGDDFEETVKTTIQSLSKGTAPPEPMIVVNALMDMISTKQTKLEPYYWLGQDAHTLWRALHALPTTVADSIKGVMQFHPIKQTLPPTGVISHVTIRVRSIETSLPFYKAFGLELYGNTEDGKQFLRSASSSKEPNWSTLILLQEDASMPTRGKSWDAGMTRLCIYTTNLSAEVQRLSNLGFEPMAPPADDGTAKIAAYYDPDSFIVYLIEFKKTLGLLVRANLWWNKRVSPSLFHWTINVADAENANQVFEKLGFKSLSDQTRDQVSQDLLPAFKISSDTTIIEHIRLCKLPQDAFIATIMQWVSPKSEGAELYNSMTVSVTDVDAAVEQAREAGMSITEPVEYRRLPVFGGVLVGTAFVESSSRVEFCCFTHKR